MPNSPFAAQIEKEEVLYTKEITAALTKAIRAKDVQKKADALTSQSTRTPPKEVKAVFEKALNAALKKIATRYRGLQIDVSPGYTMKGSQWIADVFCTVKYPMQTAGGGTRIVKPGETLWSIAEEVYGAGGYWTVLADANKAGVKSNGDFILAGYPLTLPKILVVSQHSIAPRIIDTQKPGKDSKKKARPVAYPTLEYDLEQGMSIPTIIKASGGTLIITTTFKGSLKGSKAGIIPGGFNLRTFEAEVKVAGKYFESSIKIKKSGVSEVVLASNVAGQVWKTSVSFTSTGSFKGTISPRPVKFKCKGIDFEGNVGFEIELRFIPDPPKVKVRAPRSVLDDVAEWFRNNGRTVVGIGLLAGAGAIVVGTLAEDVLTAGAGVADDPVSFAAASTMFARGLQMVH